MKMARPHLVFRHANCIYQCVLETISNCPLFAVVGGGGGGGGCLLSGGGEGVAMMVWLW